MFFLLHLQRSYVNISVNMVILKALMLKQIHKQAVLVDLHSSYTHRQMLLKKWQPIKNMLSTTKKLIQRKLRLDMEKFSLVVSHPKSATMKSKYSSVNSEMYVFIFVFFLHRFRTIKNLYSSFILLIWYLEISRLLKSKCHSTNKRINAKHSVSLHLIQNKLSMNYWKRRNKSFPAKKSMSKKLHQNLRMCKAHSELAVVTHVVADQCEVRFTIRMNDFLVSNLNEYFFMILFFNDFIGGFPKGGWGNQNYGYQGYGGYGSGQYGSGGYDAYSGYEYYPSGYSSGYQDYYQGNYHGKYFNNSYKSNNHNHHNHQQ